MDRYQVGPYPDSNVQGKAGQLMYTVRALCSFSSNYCLFTFVIAVVCEFLHYLLIILSTRAVRSDCLKIHYSLDWLMVAPTLVSVLLDVGLLYCVGNHCAIRLDLGPCP